MAYNEEIGAMTVWMEARGEGMIGMTAVAHVIANRLASRRWGSTIASVCLAPFQFSCWNDRDPNREAMARAPDADLSDADEAMYKAQEGITEDPTNGATHYYAVGTPTPAWAQPPAKLEVTIGRHNFYSGVS